MAKCSPSANSVSNSAPLSDTSARSKIDRKIDEQRWGEIWDALPASFPLPAGASPADLPEGPFSGTYTTSAAAAATADAIVSGLAARGYRPVDRSGPTEAGGVTIDATGSAAGCRVRVNVVPLGGLTAIEVLYGTACPIR